MTVSTSTPPDSPTAREQSLRVRLIPYVDRYGVWLLVILMMVVMTILQPDVFFSWRNLTNIGKQNVLNGLLALGMFVVIVTAGIDLSVGSTLAMGMIVLAVVVIGDPKRGIEPSPWYIGIGLPLIVGLFAGLINGRVFTKTQPGLILLLGAVVLTLLFGQPWYVMLGAAILIFFAYRMLIAEDAQQRIYLILTLVFGALFSGFLYVSRQSLLNIGIVASLSIVGLVLFFAQRSGLKDLKLPHPFIATLGTQFILRGLTNILSGGVPYSGLPDQVRLLGARDFFTGQVLGEGRDFPIAIIVVLVCYFVMWVFLEHTRTGRHIYAIGGNPQAARVSGINVDNVLTLVYTLCGFFAGLAALLLAGRTNSGFPNAGLGSELDAISAVIIGGASFFGGRGSVWGTLAGVLVIGLLRNALNLLGVQVFWQQVLIGVVIIVAVGLDTVRRKAGSTGG